MHKCKNFAPYLYSDLVKNPDWRDQLNWPVNTTYLRKLSGQAIRKAVKIIEQEKDDFVRQCLIVGISGATNCFMRLVEIALLAQASRSGEVVLVGGPPAIAKFANGKSAKVSTDHKSKVAPLHAFEEIKLPYFRALARTASVVSIWDGLAAFRARDGVMVSHNHLILQQIRKSRKAVRFHHAASILGDLRAHASQKRGPNTESVKLSEYGGLTKALRDLCDELASLSDILQPEMRSRLQQVLFDEIRDVFVRVAADVASVREPEFKAPRVLWSGTNGLYATRLIASEVLRRKGEVHGFDHGGTTGICSLPEVTAIVELLTTTTFTVATEPWAKLLRRSGSLQIATAVNKSEIRAGFGEPTYRNSFRDTPPSKHDELRVIYIGHVYRGFRQYATSSLPDSLYWDLQERVINVIKTLPVNLLCKPHPEGFFGSNPNPVEALAPTSYKRFEEHLDDADVFVFDGPVSTTFMEAVCTRRRVVLLEQEHHPFNDQILPEIRKRCRLVPTETDSENRVRFDHAALSKAILEEGEDPDPKYFRDMLVGDA